MKKTLLALMLSFAFVSTFAQATLKHEFRDLTHSNYSYYHSGFQHSIREYVYEILPEVSYVIPECKENNILTGFSVYDANFELTKEIPFLLEGNWSSSGTVMCAIVGKHLFNTDDKIEIGLCAQPSGYGSVKTVFINEDGEILFQADGYLLSEIYRVGNELRFEVINHNQDVLSVYSTNGSYSAEEMIVTTQAPFPNPAKNSIALPYTFDGKTTEMHIYDLQGRLVETLMLSPDNDRVHLNVSRYIPGIYVYEYNGLSQKFIVE